MRKKNRNEESKKRKSNLFHSKIYLFWKLEFCGLRKTCFTSKLGKLSLYHTFHYKSTSKTIHAYMFYS